MIYVDFFSMYLIQLTFTLNKTDYLPSCCATHFAFPSGAEKYILFSHIAPMHRQYITYCTYLI